MKKIIILFLLGNCFLSINANDNTDRYFEISKNIELFTNVYRELNSYYVDEVDPNKLMTDGIHKMLAGLDPFTNYITGADIDEYQMQTTGKYGGIGARVGRLNNEVIITDPYEGYPAQKAGLEAGDILLEIDGKSCINYNSSDVSELLKGEPGTQLTVKVKKAITHEIKTYTFDRAEIKLNNVVYSGMTGDIGIIKLVSFTDNASKEVQYAYTTLKKNPNLKGIILDLRGNGGGLLSEAIDICNTFIEKGNIIVSTKGKAPETSFEYPTLKPALDLSIPLAILIDGGSASASEIVSGAIQDLDRGIIIGQNSYGKGLVQITKPVGYKSKLKVTVSKYYIPSGRCIQRIDYSNRDELGKANVVPDSLRKVFKTKNGREVKDGAGIEPDIKTEEVLMAPITATLYMKNYIFDFASLYKTKNSTLRGGTQFKMNETEYDDFISFLKGKEYEYTTNSEDILNKLISSVKEDNLSDDVKKSISDLETKIKHDKEKDVLKYKSEIAKLLEDEIVSRYYYEKGRIENSLNGDIEVEKAKEILLNSAKYNQLLSAKK